MPVESRCRSLVKLLLSQRDRRTKPKERYDTMKSKKFVCRVFTAVLTVYVTTAVGGAEVSLQTDYASYRRLTLPTISVPIDWSWEWLPANATTATVTLAGFRSGLQHSVQVSDRSCNEVVISDFSGSWSERCDDSITVDLEFSNVSGDIAKKTFVYSFCANPGVTPLHKGTPSDTAWSTEPKSTFVVPFDVSWFGRYSAQMSMTLTDSSENETLLTVNAPAGLFAVPKRSLSAGAYHLVITGDDEVLVSSDVVLASSGLIISFR